MGTSPKGLDEDFDLDALMARVGEAAGGTNQVAAPAETSAELIGRDLALVRVIEAQGEWNEHTSKSLSALVECLRALRDDWTQEQTRLRQELSQLSAIVDAMRTTTRAAAVAAQGPVATPKPRRAASATRRSTATRRSINGERRR